MWSLVSPGRWHYPSLAVVTLFALLTPVLCRAQDDGFTGVPAIAGIRLGMSAQKAYEALKAQAGGAQTGIGEYPIAGVSNKPVAQAMSVRIINKIPSVTIRVWLTTPPSKQVVWAVGEILEYPDSDKLLTSTVSASMRQKFGQPTDAPISGIAYWALDEQGRHLPDPHNCFQAGNTNIQVEAPQGPVYQYTTALYELLPSGSACDSFVDVRANFSSTPNARYTTRIQLLEIDHAALTRNQNLYHAYIAQQNALEQKKQLEKAKQQKAPSY